MAACSGMTNRLQLLPNRNQHLVVDLGGDGGRGGGGGGQEGGWEVGVRWFKDSPESSQ